MTWDLTNTFINDGCKGHMYPGTAPFDPFNNQPKVINYFLNCTSQVSLGLSTDNVMDSDCLPPDTCPVYRQYQESGARTLYWAGTDSTGRFRTDLTYGVVVYDRNDFPQNAVLLFGSKPAVTSVTVTPAVYGPAIGSQTSK
jgi:hypothetical protein